jgi:hypothetical protein
MEPNVKGYAIQAATQFILGEPELRARVPSELLANFEREDAKIKPAEWSPRSILMTRYEAVAKAAGSEADALAALQRCGRATAGTAIKGYLKLLLRVLTPSMFARKFPDFWARDHQSGTASVSLPETNRFIFHLKDVDGFTHIGQVAAGFVGFGMEAVGMKGVQVKCTPWSLAEPAPKDLDIEVRWT